MLFNCGTPYAFHMVTFGGISKIAGTVFRNHCLVMCVCGVEGGVQSKVDYYSGLLPMGPVISHSALSVTFTDTAQG